MTAMDERTLTALKASIEHWEANAEAEKPEDATLGADYCALCGIFNPEERPSSEFVRCAGCPVQIRTGSKFCEGTPYKNAMMSHENWKATMGVMRPVFKSRAVVFRIAAQAMLDFLRSLLPADEAAP